MGPRGLTGDKPLPGIDYFIPRDGLPGKEGLPGKNGLNGINGSPDTPDQVIDKIHESKKLIDLSKIDGLLNQLSILKNRPTVSYGGGGGGNAPSKWATSTNRITPAGANGVQILHATAVPDCR